VIIKCTRLEKHYLGLELIYYINIMDTDDIYYKIFVAIMIFNSNMFNRDHVFFNIKEKYKMFSDKNKEISKYILAFSLFYSFTKDVKISFIGIILVAIFDFSIVAISPPILHNHYHSHQGHDPIG
jgi:hypothetical protein